MSVVFGLMLIALAILHASPAGADRKAHGKELDAIQRAAVNRCRRQFSDGGAEVCRPARARVSTRNPVYAIGGSTGPYGGDIAMLRRVDGRWRVLQYPYGNFVAFLCQYARKAFPKPVRRDFKLRDNQGRC